MQGKRTEGAAVLAITKAVRNGQAITVKITNYRKSGQEFVLSLALQPVHDKNGLYRYSIGLLCEPTAQGADTKFFQKVMGLLPTKFDAVAQPVPFSPSLKKVDPQAQLQQWGASLEQLTALVWSVNWDKAFRSLQTSPEAMAALGAFLHNTAPQEAKMLQLCVKMKAIEQVPREEQYGPLLEAFRNYFGMDPADPDPLRMLGVLEQEVKNVELVLANDSLLRFALDPAGLPVIRSIAAPSAGAIQKADDYLWKEYNVPDDMAGWLHAFVNVALSYPVPIVVSDMSMQGNPMCFVNNAFCRLTGYDRREVQGRNCRFLQGPRTEQQCVAMIQDTLRRGVDCHVKITNYRKNGGCFVNLLSIRPVHDSNGVYRYCIGVQFEIEASDKDLKSNLSKLDRLMEMFPTVVSVASKPIGLEHRSEVIPEETSSTTEDKLLRALAGGVVLRSDDKLHEGGYFANNYEEHMRHCAKVSGYKADPQLHNFAKLHKLTPPQTAPWLVMFSELADQLPISLVLVDLKVPGLPITHVNRAACDLTGYAYDEMVGRNCRFLQGNRTKGSAVLQLTTAIRKSVPVEVQLTNYRQDGSEFEVLLALHPVFDDTGTCRYMIGLHCNLAGTKIHPATDRKLFNKIRGSLPDEFESVLQVAKWDPMLAEVSDAAQLKQWARSLEVSARLTWSNDVDETLQAMLNTPSAVAAFSEYLKKNTPDKAMKLDMCLMAAQLPTLPLAQQGAATMQVCTNYGGVNALTMEAAVAHLQTSVKQAMRVLADVSLVNFLQAKECTPLLRELIGPAVEKIQKVSEHVWTKYEVPEDMRGWFYASVNFANSYPLGMCITEMSLTGCPLIFVNPAFLALTGYDKVEVLGRNCRFLQGEKTEQWPVAVMIDSLRRGVDCHVKITNYKKNGSTFCNLLTLRPVHDSNSVYRYCIGILVDLGSGCPSSDVVSKLDRLMRLMPDTVDVVSPAVGPKHESKYADEELEQSIEERINAAMSDATKIYTSEMLEDSEFYQRNYTDHLEYIQMELPALLSLGAPTFEPTPPPAKAKTDNPSPLHRRMSFRAASTRGE